MSTGMAKVRSRHRRLPLISLGNGQWKGMILQTTPPSLLSHPFPVAAGPLSSAPHHHLPAEKATIFCRLLQRKKDSQLPQLLPRMILLTFQLQAMQASVPMLRTECAGPPRPMLGKLAGE